MKMKSEKQVDYGKLKTIRKILLVVIFIMVIAIIKITSINANGESDILDSKRMYYHEMEKRYENVVRKTLEDKGYANAGITIISNIDPSGTRTFKTKIHHRKFTEMDDNEKKSFLKDVSKISFADADTEVVYEIF